MGMWFFHLFFSVSGRMKECWTCRNENFVHSCRYPHAILPLDRFLPRSSIVAFAFLFHSSFLVKWFMWRNVLSDMEKRCAQRWGVLLLGLFGLGLSLFALGLFLLFDFGTRNVLVNGRHNASLGDADALGKSVEFRIASDATRHVLRHNAFAVMGMGLLIGQDQQFRREMLQGRRHQYMGRSRHGLGVASILEATSCASHREHQLGPTRTRQ